MFTFDTIADGYAKTTRQVLNFMPNETIRDSLIALTEAQVKVAKNLYETQQSANEKFLLLPRILIGPRTLFSPSNNPDATAMPVALSRLTFRYSDCIIHAYSKERSEK